MVPHRAVLVDRDPTLLSRLTGELSRSGFVVESLSSTVGLTPDLLDLAKPELLLLDHELPGMNHAALLVIIRSLKARHPLRVVVSTEQDPRLLKDKVLADQVVARARLVAEGARALGLSTASGSTVDLRAIIDEVLGQRPASSIQSIELRIDLFSKGNFCVANDGRLGVFVPSTVLLPVGQRVELQIDLLGREKLKFTGEVVWQRGHSSFGGKVATGVGVRLLDVSEAQRQAISRFLETRQPLNWAG